MPGYDDPRYLQQVIQAQGARISRLEQQIKQVPKFGVQPTTPQAILWGENIGNPLLFISDGKRNRFSIGNLPTYTDPNGVVSPALYGYRALDDQGRLIGDSEGQSLVMSELGHVLGTGPPFATFTTTTPTLVTVNGVNASITFTLSRQLRVLSLFSVVASSAGDVGLVDTFVDGVNKSPGHGPHAVFGIGTVQTSVAYYSEPLAAGSHTIQARAYVQTSGGGQVLTVDTFDLICWQLGA